MSYVNFAELKNRVSILDTTLMLNLDLMPGNNQLRSSCPACESGDSRALVVTPGKDVFYCHDAKLGGDCIALIAHINGTGMKEAAVLLDNYFPVEQSDGGVSVVETKEETMAWQGLSYLEPEHDLVQELGFDVETCEILGIGYAKKGIMRGRVAVPIRMPNGVLVGYIGINEVKLPTSWRF